LKSLLIIHKKQFGYHIDTYKLVSHLSKYFKITYICFDSGLPKLEVLGVNIQYVSSIGGVFERAVRFFKTSFYHLKKTHDVVFLDYFHGCSLLIFFSKSDIILDYRTGSVHANSLKRKIGDVMRAVEAKFFSRVTVISDGLRKKLCISSDKSYILPLGADVMSKKPKVFDVPRLFYIGTLNNREMYKTISGVSLFLESNPSFKSSLTYDIVGTGYKREEIKLQEMVKELQLENNITIHGRKSHHEIQPLLDHCNIGVSFIPITTYFDHQPPTKTFEYVLSGMVCMATSTSENKRYINTTNGILHSDTPEAFAGALEKVVLNFNDYNSKSIQHTLKNHTWKNIASQFKAYLDNE